MTKIIRPAAPFTPTLEKFSPDPDNGLYKAIVVPAGTSVCGAVAVLTGAEGQKL
jgi:hypothetical protein